MRISSFWLALGRVAVCMAITGMFMLYTAGFQTLPVLDRVNNVLYDFRLRKTLAKTIDPRIVIVAIDEASLEQEGQWPWSREKMAYLMDILFSYYQIKLLGFDMVFSEPDHSSGMGVLEKLASEQLKNDAKFLSAFKELKPRLSYDQVFAQSLRDGPVVMGYFFSHIQERVAQVGRLTAPLATPIPLPFDSSFLFNAKSYVANLPVIQDAARSAGYFENPYIDQDGIYRRLPLIIQYQGKIYQSL